MIDHVTELARKALDAPGPLDAMGASLICDYLLWNSFFTSCPKGPMWSTFEPGFAQVGEAVRLFGANQEVFFEAIGRGKNAAGFMCFAWFPLPVVHELDLPTSEALAEAQCGVLATMIPGEGATDGAVNAYLISLMLLCSPSSPLSPLGLCAAHS